MKAERHLPVDVLKPFIKAFLIMESDEGMTNRLLPDTSIVAAFRIRGKVTGKEPGHENTLPASVISGLRRTVREVSYSQHSATLFVLFHEGGASAFFDLPMHELFDKSVALENLSGRQEAGQLGEQLAEAANDMQRIALVERFFISKLRRTKPDALIGTAIRRIRESNGATGIAELAQSLFISQDAFEKRFRSVAGASPKRFAATVRFRQLVSRYTPGTSFTELAYLGGYFDQSHFIRDFRSFTGQAPHDFFKNPRYW